MTASSHRSPDCRLHNSSASRAYRVPFLVDRSTPPWYRLIHVGDADVRGVTVTELDGSGGIVGSSAPVRLSPGDELPFAVRTRAPEISTTVIVRWFRHDGAEYVWRLSF